MGKPIQKIVSITGLLVCGTVTAITAKLLFQLKAWNKYGQISKWQVPFMETALMFLGMASCIMVHIFQTCTSKKRAKDMSSMLSFSEPFIEEQSSISEKKSIYLLVMIPTLFDLVATTFGSIGLLWVKASVYQMLRGSLMIFGAFFSIMFGMKKLRGYQWAGLLINLIALIAVAFASTENTMTEVVTSKTSKMNHDVFYEIIGCCFIVAGQAVQALQFLVEEKLMGDMDVSPLLIVGMEGVWGLILMGAILFGIQYTGPVTYEYSCSYGHENHGKSGPNAWPAECTVNLSDFSKIYHEDSLNTLYMLYHDQTIQIVSAIYVVSILGLNISGMNITRLMSAVSRTVFETCRTLLIWVTGLCLAYFYGKGQYGEKWNKYSYLQAGSFILLIIGTFVYNKIIKIPSCFYYPDRAPLIVR